MAQCQAVYLFNGVGKPLIRDEYIREVFARAQSTVARVIECTSTAVAVVVAAPVGQEEHRQEAERLF